MKMDFEKDGIRYIFFCYNESIGGGKNNLAVAEIALPSSGFQAARACSGRLGKTIATGTSLIGREQAMRNAKRNFNRAYPDLIWLHVEAKERKAESERIARLRKAFA